LPKAHFDGFVMLNLYAQRTLFSDQLHPKLNISLQQENVQIISILLPIIYTLAKPFLIRNAKSQTQYASR
ncbi:MAG: hypothetical protein KAJ23_15425, partial [Maribacter sp.]|nr:hypothetical protein [Maribacter sp.]